MITYFKQKNTIAANAMNSTRQHFRKFDYNNKLLEEKLNSINEINHAGRVAAMANAVWNKKRASHHVGDRRHFQGFNHSPELKSF